MIFHSFCGQFTRPPNAPRETVQNQLGSLSKYDTYNSWILQLFTMAVQLPIDSSNVAESSLIARTAIQIVHNEFSARFGESIFAPALTEFRVSRWSAKLNEYTQHTSKLADLLVHDTFSQGCADREQFAIPIHGTHFLLLRCVHFSFYNLHLLDTHSAHFTQLVSLHIAINKLCLHRLLFLENYSPDQKRPDCFAAFTTDHAQRGFSVCTTVGCMLRNLELLRRMQDGEEQDFLRESTLEILYQLIAPFYEACKAHSALPANAALIGELYAQLAIVRQPFLLGSNQVPKLSKDSQLDEIQSLLAKLTALPFASPRDHLGLLKFWRRVRTQAVQGTTTARWSEVHEDMLYDALHMQLPIALLDADTFARVYNDFQRGASTAHPLNDGSDQFPWLQYYALAPEMSPRDSMTSLVEASEGAKFARPAEPADELLFRALMLDGQRWAAPGFDMPALRSAAIISGPALLIAPHAPPTQSGSTSTLSDIATPEYPYRTTFPDHPPVGVQMYREPFDGDYAADLAYDI